MVKENQYHTAERQELLLAMMKDVHTFLEENEIVYSLVSGSLLGAVRHDGFIPWDDDIDLMMDRDNYERLLKIFSQCDGYVIQRTLWINRIQREQDRGVRSLAVPTIDLFVIDPTPHQTWKRKYQLLRLKMLQGMMKDKVDYSSYSFVYRCCLRATYWMGKLFSDERKYKKYDRVSQMGNREKATTVCCCNDPFHCLPFCYDKNLMEKTSLHTFEDTEFRITDLYDHYLTVHYGSDYMTPPPEKDRRPIHLI